MLFEPNAAVDVLPEPPFCLLSPVRPTRLRNSPVQVFGVHPQGFHVGVDLVKRGAVLVHPPSISQPSNHGDVTTT